MSRPAFLENDINFESLQREILEAEEYLVRNSSEFSTGAKGAYGLTSIDPLSCI